MKNLMMCVAILGGVSIASASHAAVITHTFDTKVTDSTANASGAPTVAFDDAGGSGTVTMTIDLNPLSSAEFISTYWFNFSNAGTTALTISRTAGTGPTSSWISISPVSANAYNSAGPNGLFDAMISFETSNTNGGERRFNYDELLTFTLTGAGITAADFDVMSAVGGGGSGSLLGQMHIQGIGANADGSVHVGPGDEVPEPGALSLLGLALLAVAGALRRRQATV
jgi:hypothetical protein